MIPKEIKDYLHYDDVRGDFLRPPILFPLQKH